MCSFESQKHKKKLKKAQEVLLTLSTNSDKWTVNFDEETVQKIVN